MQQSGITTGRSSGEIGGPLPVVGENAIDILLNDHRTIKGLLSTLTAATQTSARRAALEQLKAVLTVHNATEENLVYPAIDKIAEQHGEASELYHQTSEADVAIFEIDTMLKKGDGADVSSKAEALAQAILEHIDKEESSAFRHLREKADATQSESLTQSVREFRRSLRFDAPTSAA
jgi:hemerythrin superfamily protein